MGREQAMTTPRAGQGIVLYDGACQFCRTSVDILKRLDWLQRLHFQSARDAEHLILDRQRLLEEMHVLTPDRRHAYAGFDAFRWMAWRLPLTMPLAPLLYIPGVRWLGTKMYRWVAKHRFDLVPCSHGECRVTGQNSTRR